MTKMHYQGQTCTTLLGVRQRPHKLCKTLPAV